MRTGTQSLDGTLQRAVLTVVVNVTRLRLLRLVLLLMRLGRPCRSCFIGQNVGHWGQLLRQGRDCGTLVALALLLLVL